MKNYIVIPLTSKPGIQRDSTPFLSQSYIDGQWVRFYMELPRKIGGYKLIDAGNTEIARSLFSVPKNNSVDLYIGRSSSVKFNHFDFNGNGDGEIDRTPSGYIVNPNNVWDFDLFTTSENSFIVASAIPNGNDVSNTIKGKLYYGNINDPTQLTVINGVEVSGGIVFSSPVMIAFGNGGLIRWSALGDITLWPDTFNLVIANTKIIQAYRTRGSTAPQILCWTLNSLINVTYSPTDGDPGFASSTIQDNITVMSPNSIVEYNQQFFWIGIDQFYFFNGIVQRLDNSMSTDWFFNNVNLQQRSKVWGMTVPRYKEIWWFYPRKRYPEDNPTECNAVVIYNTELQVWYDSVISRAAGLSPGIFPLPLMSDANTPSITPGRGTSNTYGIWMHEYGRDEVIGVNNYAIESHFETKILTLFENNPENNRLMRTRRIEPDFSQPLNSNMTVTVNNRMFPSDPNILSSGPYTFGPETPKIDDVNSQGRLVSFVFRSNEAGGDYQAGKTLLDYEVGDIRP